MTHRLLSILFLFALVGCSASAKYDIDVKCPMKNLDSVSQQGVQAFICSGIIGEGFSDFMIQCDSKAVQSVGDDWFCSTTDGKSVRIKTKE